MLSPGVKSMPLAMRMIASDALPTMPTSSAAQFMTCANRSLHRFSVSMCAARPASARGRSRRYRSSACACDFKGADSAPV